jgi:hypothetical protein
MPLHGVKDRRKIAVWLFLEMIHEYEINKTIEYLCE